MTTSTHLRQLPTLQPGDSHMESLIEAAIQGHADTREAMRWLVRQLVPVTQPAEVTRDEVMQAAKEATAPEWQDVVDGWHMGLDLMAFARSILALRPVQSGLTGCNCRWDGDTQVQWCELHLAHKEAIHEWAERAKSAEQKLALRPEQVPMTDERSVTVKVDRELFSFHSEQDWVNKARSRYANCVVQKGHYITVDAAGHVMHMGLCFKHAVYPVTVYQLQTNWPKEKA